MEQLVADYGYWAILVGTFLEGETIVILGGLAAKFGHLEIDYVILSAVVGTVLGDQLYFLIGRRYGKKIVEKRPVWRARAERVDVLISKWDVYLVLTFRFMYGLRSVASFAFGMSSIDFKKFVVLNIVGAAIWAVVMSYAGYFLGKGAELLLGEVQGRGLMIVVAVALLGLLFWLSFRWHRRSQRQRITRECAPPLRP